MKMTNAALWNAMLELCKLEEQVLAMKKLCCTGSMLDGHQPRKNDDPAMPTVEQFSDAALLVTNQALKIKNAGIDTVNGAR